MRLILVLLLSVLRVAQGTGQSQLIGSSQPVVATVGDDVILPCHVEPRLNVEELVVEWWRPGVPPDPGDHDRYVHRYLDNQDVENMKMPSYAGRTVLFKDQLKHGNLSLKLMNVKLSDEGRYLCVLPQLQSKQRGTVIQLSVEEPKVTGSAAVTAAVGDDIILPCSSQPPHDVTTLRVDWKLNGRTVHTYRSRADDLDGQDVNFKNRTSLFKGEMAKGNISLKLTNVREEDAGTYTCSVFEHKIPVIKAHVTLSFNAGGGSDKTKDPRPDTPTTDWILYPVFLIIAAAALGSIICVVQRKRRNSNAAPASEERPPTPPTSEVALLQRDAQEQTRGQRQERRESSSQNQEDNTL